MFYPLYLKDEVDVGINIILNVFFISHYFYTFLALGHSLLFHCAPKIYTFVISV